MGLMRRERWFAGLVAVGAVVGSAPLGESHPARPRSVWNGDIYLVNADGTGKRRLTRDPAEEFDPAWSADGTKIAFSRFTGRRYEIWVMNADGTGAAQLTRGESGASDAAWSPDGRRIAYKRCHGLCEIYVMNADGSGETQLTFGEHLNEQSPTWSPDGKRIAFAAYEGIFTMSAGGGDWRQVTIGPADDANPAWSPVAPQIAFDGSRAVYDGDIYVVREDGSLLTDLTDSLPLDSNPSWSPDGRKIAFMRKANKRARARVFLMNADGTAPTSLRAIGDAYSRPSWSPDGTKLAYSLLTACIVPPVAGKELDDARARIRRASCSVGRVRFTASARPTGTVLSQRPQARAERRVGTRVNLVVSSGS
jgi:Tol biopolymer transport system component